MRLQFIVRKKLVSLALLLSAVLASPVHAQQQFAENPWAWFTTPVSWPPIGPFVARTQVAPMAILIVFIALFAIFWILLRNVKIFQDDKFHNAVIWIALPLALIPVVGSNFVSLVWSAVTSGLTVLGALAFPLVAFLIVLFILAIVRWGGRAARGRGPAAEAVAEGADRATAVDEGRNRAQDEARRRENARERQDLGGEQTAATQMEINADAMLTELQEIKALLNNPQIRNNPAARQELAERAGQAWQQNIQIHNDVNAIRNENADAERLALDEEARERMEERIAQDAQRRDRQARGSRRRGTYTRQGAQFINREERDVGNAERDSRKRYRKDEKITQDEINTEKNINNVVIQLGTTDSQITQGMQALLGNLRTTGNINLANQQINNLEGKVKTVKKAAQTVRKKTNRVRKDATKEARDINREEQDEARVVRDKRAEDTAAKQTEGDKWRAKYTTPLFGPNKNQGKTK